MEHWCRSIQCIRKIHAKKASWLKAAISPECIGKVGWKHGESLICMVLANWGGVFSSAKSGDVGSNVNALSNSV